MATGGWPDPENHNCNPIGCPYCGRSSQLEACKVCTNANKRLREALSEAIEMAEDCMQYVSEYLVQKWGYDDDLARIKAALIDGDGGGCGA